MPANKNLKILFIEDSPYDAELAQITLERSGFVLDTELAYDHDGVVRALQQREFDLVLADFILPGFSGAQALELARELAPQTPFIFLSGVYGEEHAVNMMRSGAVDYVLKQNLAFLPKAVERAVAEVNERRRRLQAEQALREVEVRARLAVDAARLGMWDYEPQSDTLIWDQRCRAMFGLTVDEPVSMATFERLCHPDDIGRMRRRIEAAIARQNDRDYAEVYRVCLPDDRVRWLETRGQAFFENGRCVRFVGVVMDITEQKLATEALKQLNEKLGERVQERTRERDRTWDLSRDLLAVTRFDTTPIALNPAWESTLGWPREKLLQGPLSDLVHPDDVQATLEETASIASGQVSNRFVNRLRHADGSYHWLSWNAVPDAGHMYAAARDITSEIATIDKLAESNRQLLEQIGERERMEETLQQMQRLEAVGQLTAGVAHDFNNLLTVILTSTSFLKHDLESGAPSTKALARLQYIRDAGERGAMLTSQLLAFSRRQQLAPKAISLNDTITGMLNLLQSSLGGSVAISVDAAADLWPAMVDPTQIEMIILNLAINARDAMGSGGQLVLRTGNISLTRPAERPEDPLPGDYVVLAVSDNGTGMTDEVLRKAFEPFFTTKEVGKGSGLGLAQVFGFAKQSGGGASIESEPGVGTTVKVFLPRACSTLAVAENADHPARPPTPSVRHAILLVDDDQTVREVTAQMLDTLGYSVIEADSGAKALELLENGVSVDLLLADFAMPTMNGGELARRVRSHYVRLPVVFITGYAELGELGLDGAVVVQKPFREEQLADKLMQALRERSPV